VIVPALPGALSAYGILVSNVVKDYSRTVLLRVVGKLPLKQLEGEFGALEKVARRAFAEEEWKGSIRMRRSADVRYRGQGYELNIPYSRDMAAAFRQEHQRRYGYGYADREVELVTLRVRATLRSPTVAVNSVKKSAPGRREFALVDGKKTSIYSRESLGGMQKGPAVVTEYSATTFVPAGMRFGLDRSRNLVVHTSEPKVPRLHKLIGSREPIVPLSTTRV
jgi:N-methylhydantoinase A